MLAVKPLGLRTGRQSEEYDHRGGTGGHLNRRRQKCRAIDFGIVISEPRGEVLSGEAAFRLRRDPDSTFGIDLAYISAEMAAGSRLV